MTESSKEMDLTSNQVDAFLQSIDVRLGNDKMSNLQIIVSNFMEHVPFQNLTMLIGPRRRPKWNEICDDLISGIGGLCTARNPFLKVLLQKLGYDVYFISSSMIEPDCHIGLVVTIDSTKYWIDVGNGYPYNFPYKLGSGDVIVHPFMNYRVVKRNDTWFVEHEFNDSGQWKINQTFNDKEVPYSFFDNMHELHYTVEDYGPFLRGLRANRWWKYGGIILRDNLVNDLESEHKISNISDFKKWIKQLFPSSPINSNEITEKAWNAYTSLELEAII